MCTYLVQFSVKGSIAFSGENLPLMSVCMREQYLGVPMHMQLLDRAAGDADRSAEKGANSKVRLTTSTLKMDAESEESGDPLVPAMRTKLNRYKLKTNLTDRLEYLV